MGWCRNMGLFTHDITEAPLLPLRTGTAGAARPHDLGSYFIIGDHNMSIEMTDVAIIGGGYYGAFVANEIKTLNPDLDVTVIEKEDAPFTKASSTNQGHFHMGYMYSGNRALAGECVENIAR